jgi:hypothetical protein
LVFHKRGGRGGGTALLRGDSGDKMGCPVAPQATIPRDLHMGGVDQ